MLGFLSDYFAINSPTSVETRNAYLIALGMALISLTTVTVTGRMGYLGYILGMLIRIIATGALYKKVSVFIASIKFSFSYTFHKSNCSLLCLSVLHIHIYTFCEH